MWNPLCARNCLSALLTPLYVAGILEFMFRRHGNGSAERLSNLPKVMLWKMLEPEFKLSSWLQVLCVQSLPL